jgi:hypothetical protein
MSEATIQRLRRITVYCWYCQPAVSRGNLVFAAFLGPVGLVPFDGSSKLAARSHSVRR